MVDNSNGVSLGASSVCVEMDLNTKVSHYNRERDLNLRVLTGASREVICD
jgi:hypothetical protein